MRYRKAMNNVSRETLEGWEAMKALKMPGGYEHVAAQQGRGGAPVGRVGEKLLQLVKYGKKLSTYVDKYVDKMICR